MATCSFCGGVLEGRSVQHEYRWEGNLFVFEDVPALVCRQCGEKYFDAKVVKAMEAAVLHQLEPRRILQVPVFSYSELVGLTE
jgi:YgiT-type zinc finger domain-containing protein